MLIDRGIYPDIPCRVIGQRRRRITVAYYLQYAWPFERHRTIPEGTPIYFHHESHELRLMERDRSWNPFRHSPCISPAVYRVLGGNPRWRGGYITGLTQVGAYQPPDWYDVGDPCWAWSDGWHPAEVVALQRSWITVRYLDDYVRVMRTGSRRISSHRPADIWPVLNDYPEVRVIDSADYFPIPNLD